MAPPNHYLLQTRNGTSYSTAPSKSATCGAVEVGGGVGEGGGGLAALRALLPVSLVCLFLWLRMSLRLVRYQLLTEAEQDGRSNMAAEAQRAAELALEAAAAAEAEAAANPKKGKKGSAKEVEPDEVEVDEAAMAPPVVELSEEERCLHLIPVGPNGQLTLQPLLSPVELAARLRKRIATACLNYCELHRAAMVRYLHPIKFYISS